MVGLGDADWRAPGALVGLKSVSRITGRGSVADVGAIAGLAASGEPIERRRALRELDAAGRQP